MFLAKTVAEIETQSYSATAVGQSRGADGDNFLHFLWRTKLLPQTQIQQTWNVCSN